jgi:hypothetical protein
MKKLSLIFVLIILFSCKNNNVAENILSPQKMEIVLWEQMKADAFTKEFISKNSNIQLTTENFKLQQKIFDKFGIDKNDFYKTYKYYLNDVNLMSNLLDSIIAHQTAIHQKEFENSLNGRIKLKWYELFGLKDIFESQKNAPFNLQIPIDNSKNNNLLKEL